MTSKLIGRRFLEAGGLFLAGDSMMGLLRSRRHSLLWHFGPELGRAATEELIEHPKIARSVYVAELALGLALWFGQISNDTL